MKKSHTNPVLCFATAFCLASVALAQTTPTQPLAASGPNNWEKEYADGKAAYAAGNYREAEKQLKAAYKSTREFASNDPKLLNTLNDLAQVYRAESKYQTAQHLIEH